MFKRSKVRSIKTNNLIQYFNNLNTNVFKMFNKTSSKGLNNKVYTPKISNNVLFDNKILVPVYFPTKFLQRKT